MKARYLLLLGVLIGAMAVTVAGTAGAFGSGSASEPKKPDPVTSGKAASAPKCKLVCASIFSSGTIFFASPKGVVAVDHFSTGDYCVEFDKKVPIFTSSPILLTPDFENSPFDAYNLSYRQPCGVNGIHIHNENDAGTDEDIAFTIVIP